MKRFLAILLALALTLSLFGVIPVFAATGDSDTVLVLDYSGSMNRMAGDILPVDALKEAASIFCEGVVSANLTGSGTHRVAVIIYDNTFIFKDFTSDYATLYSFINETNMGGGTCIAAPLKKARELIQSSSAEIKNVLLMTDGLPEHGDWSDTGPYTSADYNGYGYANAAYNAAVELRKDCRLYTLGFLHLLPQLSEAHQKFAPRFLDDLQGEGYWEVIDPEDLEITFEDILSTMQEVTQEWWATLPDWLQWILRYLFFGWFWMNL